MAFSKFYNTLFHDSHSFKKSMVFPNASITPEVAQEIMRLNDNNRPIRSVLVEQYAKEMTKGEWHFNGDNIRISKTGRLLDGQHRLLAVIKSGTTQVWNVVTGLNDEVFDVIDIGRGRSAGDSVSVMGYKNANVLAGSVKLILAYNGGVLRRAAQGGAGSDKFTNQDVVDYIETLADKDLLQEAAGLGNKLAYKAKFYSPASYAAFYYLFSKKDRDAANLFLDLLVTGENISKSSYSMIYLLRNRLIQNAGSTAKLQALDKYSLMIKAWNAYRKGKEIAQLAWNSNNEEFPKIL